MIYKVEKDSEYIGNHNERALRLVSDHTYILPFSFEMKIYVFFAYSISFPYLVLLVSGGHCILAVAKGVGDFVILGETRDTAPGEAFDKVSRLQLGQ